jgi:hypothetical protein
MFIKTCNDLVTSIIIILIFLFLLNIIIKENFEIVNCPRGQIEGSDGKCDCPLIGQVYDTINKKCICGDNKTEQIINNKTVCK